MSLAWYKPPPEQDAMPGQHWGQKVPWSQGIDSGAALLARMYLLLLQVQSTAAGPDGQEEIRPLPSSRDEGIREARRVITLGISAAMMAEAQNFTVKLIHYVLEGIGNTGFKLHKGPNSYTLWS